MDTMNSERKCLLCQSKNLQYGGVGASRHTFVPKNKMMLIGYDVLAYVCLDCGTLGYYLDNSDIQDIRKFKEKKNK